MVSALTNRKVKGCYAMTGAINLRGYAIHIGGVKEKILAAKKIGAKFVIIPEDNRADVQDLDEYVTKGIEVVFVKHVDEVLKLVLV
jgi:ATP-dependent Lon protease